MKPFESGRISQPQISAGRKEEPVTGGFYFTEPCYDFATPEFYTS